MVVCVLIPRFRLLTALGTRRELLREPVALAPEADREQVVGEASGAAEAVGIHAGMRLGEALARCPELRLVPPDPDGVPERTQADWLQEGLNVLWRQGVSLITWFNIRDQDASQGFEFSNQSGVYLRDGTPKLSLQAFEFPFVMDRRGGGTIAWGRAPTAGTVQIQRMSGSGFVTVSTVGVRRLQVFSTTLKNAPAALAKAQLALKDAQAAGDARGRIYTTTNLRTLESWTMPDSEHQCGGA